MQSNPHLYEINAQVFLRRLSERYGRKLTLATMPREEWRLIADRGFNMVWLMGVWQRSQAARQQALFNNDLRRWYDKVLPGWTDDDVGGSPYAVHSYTLDRSLGDEDDLGKVKARLNNQGLTLLLDFIPNHFAMDTPLLSSHSEWFVPGEKEGIDQHPERFFSPDGTTYFAHGRDPNFPPWTDTVQVNFFSRELRQSLIAELLKIAEVADGVRCDMAMLALNDVFERVWGKSVVGYTRPDAEFWSVAIRIVKEHYPGFIFLGETYWGLEHVLLDLGFDFVYDKGLYDRLRFANAAGIRDYLAGSTTPLERTVHFVENHDEARAVIAFDRERSLAAATVVATVPGIRLCYDGQLEGKRVHLPVQLLREPEEVGDDEVPRFYQKLLVISDAPAFCQGEWTLLPIQEAWESNNSHDDLLAWSWRYAKQLKVVAVNYAAHQSQGRLKLPVWLPHGTEVAYRDELTDVQYQGKSDELSALGLYVDLGPWSAHIFDMDVAEVL